MSVWKRKDGRYGAKRVVTQDDGRNRLVQVTAGTRREALARLDDACRRAAVGKPTRDSSATLAVTAARWVEITLASSDRAATTKELYAGEVRRHLIGAGTGGGTATALPSPASDRSPHVRVGQITLRRLRPSDIEEFLLYLERRGFSATSRRRILQIIRAVLDTAMRDGLVGTNVARAVGRPSAPPAEARSYSPGQVSSLLAAAERERLSPLIVLLAHTGLRVGEALGLNWEEVTLGEDPTLRVNGTLVRLKGVGLTKTAGKTARARRSIPLDAAATHALAKWRQNQVRERLLAGSLWSQGPNWVFTTELGTPLDQRNLNRWYRNLSATAGVGGTFHTLRHTFASLLLADGESVRTVADLMGHAKTSTTWDTYGHVAAETRRSATDRLARLMSKEWL